MATILTVGEILVEVMAARRGQTFTETGTFTGPYASGAPAIFIDQVARLGAGARMIGRVGDDGFGKLNRNRLSADGVDVRFVSVDRDLPTGIAFVTYAVDGSRSFLFTAASSAAAGLTSEFVVPEAIAGCDALHVSGSSLFTPTIATAIETAVRAAKAAGLWVSFDPNVRPELLAGPFRPIFDAIIAKADVVVPSVEDLGVLFPGQATDAAARELLSRGARWVACKRGADGATLYGADTRVDRAAFPVTEVDPTGAGDAFSAGLLVGLLKDLPPEMALAQACATGALAVTKQGPMEGLGKRADIETMLAGA